MSQGGWTLEALAVQLKCCYVFLPHCGVLRKALVQWKERPGDADCHGTSSCRTWSPGSEGSMKLTKLAALGSLKARAAQDLENIWELIPQKPQSPSF